MQWLEAIEDNKPWVSIFGGSLPKELRLSMIVLRGDTVAIKGFAPLVGMTYPEKWQKKGFNAFEFEIFLHGVNEVSVTDCHLFGVFSILVDMPNVTIETESGCVFKCRAEGISVLKIDGFYDEQL